MENEDHKKEGFIFAYRGVRKHWLWKDKPFSKGQAWLDLLMGANHAPAKFLLKGQLVKVNRGEQCRSQLTLAKDWGWSRKKVKTFLEMLEQDGMIVYDAAHLTTLISICNYDSFQTLSTSKVTTEEQQKSNEGTRTKTNNNVNNNKGQLSTKTPELLTLAKYIYQQLEKKKLIEKEPRWAKWQTDLKTLTNREDCEGINHVIKVFNWAHAHDFWQDKIKSPVGLVNSWEELNKQIKKDRLRLVN